LTGAFEQERQHDFSYPSLHDTPFSACARMHVIKHVFDVKNGWLAQIRHNKSDGCALKTTALTFIIQFPQTKIKQQKRKFSVIFAILQILYRVDMLFYAKLAGIWIVLRTKALETHDAYIV
jgi:hypothetical protein